MLYFLQNHYKKILVVLLIITIIRFINLIGVEEDYNAFEALIMDLLRPALGTMEKVDNWTKNTLRVIVNYQQIKEENQRLKEEIATLRYNNQQLTKILMQNQRLRELLNFKKYTPYQIAGASVIGYGADNWSSIVIINRGSKAGISHRMPVVAEEGYLVGTVQKVSKYTSQVMLLNDPNFVVGGLVRREESRALGVVKGQSKENDKLKMDNISWDADIKPDDIIVTSGLSQYLPKGLPIGKVISVSPDNYGLTQSAILVPFVELDKLEEVLVITDFSAKTEQLLPPLKAYPDFNQEGE